MKIFSSPVDLIKRSLEIFFEKENFIYFMKIYSLLIPFSLFSIFQDYFISSQSKTLSVNDPTAIILKYPWFLAAVVVVNLMYLFVSFLVGIVSIKAIKGIVDGKKESIKESYSYAWKNLWGFSVMSLLVFLATVGGLILLIIPGIIFSVWFYFSKFVFVDQKLSAVESMKKSKALITGNFWAVFGRIIVFGIFTGLFTTILSVVPYAGSVAVMLFGALFMIPTYLLYAELIG